MKIWGVEQWMKASDGSILNEGDVIRTDPGSRIVLSLRNGSAIRLNSETEVEVTVLKTKDGRDEASFALKKGEIWLKSTPDKSVRTAFSVATPHIETNALGATFDVESTSKEAVHVTDGKASVAVKIEEDEGQTRIVDTVEVVFGQEVSIGPRELEDLKNNKPVDLLALLSDELRGSDWYKWNRAEDISGEAVLSVEDAVKQQKEEAAPAQVVEAQPVQLLSAPVVVSPKESERTTKTGTILISGETSGLTAKIEVTTYIGGKSESYNLQKYKQGSVSWSYLASREYGNLVAGENRFTITAIGKDGQKSDSTEFVVFYDKPKEPADLSVPVVTGFNGNALASANFETTEDSVLVNGKIGKGIVKVYVNDFVLTKYVPDSGIWGYYAKTQYNNLHEGGNEYVVYGVDVEGQKTPIAKFTITKNSKPKEELAPAPAAVPPGEPVL